MLCRTLTKIDAEKANVDYVYIVLYCGNNDFI